MHVTSYWIPILIQIPIWFISPSLLGNILICISSDHSNANVNILQICWIQYFFMIKGQGLTQPSQSNKLGAQLSLFLFLYIKFFLNSISTDLEHTFILSAGVWEKVRELQNQFFQTAFQFIFVFSLGILTFLISWDYFFYGYNRKYMASDSISKTILVSLCPCIFFK